MSQIIFSPPEEKEAIKYIWDDFKMRQAHCWATFNRNALAIITILIVPYLKPDIMKPLGRAVLIFPIVGLILSLVSTWLLGAEYQRLRAVKELYERLLTDKYALKYLNETKIQCCFGWRIGTAMVWM